MNKILPKKFLAFLFIGLSIFLVYLFFTIGINEILNVFQGLNIYHYLLYYTLALISVFLSTLLYSMSWNKLMESVGIRIGIKRTFLYCWLGNFVDAITPFETVSGEITRIYLVQRETGEPPGKIVASVIAHRIIVTFIALGSLTISSIFLITKCNISAGIIYPLLLIISGSIAVTFLLMIMSLKRGVAERVADTILNFIAFILKGHVNLLETRRKVHQNIQCFYNDFRHIGGKRWTLTLAVSYNFLAWLLHLSVFLLTFYALGFSEIVSKISETIVAYSINMALQVAPISLVTPGLIEIIMTNIYVLLGFNPALSGVATLFIRIATFWLQVLSGGIIVQWMGVKNMFEQIFKGTSTC
ncbi:MAG: lysylphosphatidylglycerol synthase transmembrane domain-containing protein [Candidatus Bathyarchaeia archaeon]